jgi:hypothetical protein
MAHLRKGRKHLSHVRLYHLQCDGEGEASTRFGRKVGSEVMGVSEGDVQSVDVYVYPQIC